jgi:hypothetical protein
MIDSEKVDDEFTFECGDVAPIDSPGATRCILSVFPKIRHGAQPHDRTVSEMPNICTENNIA